MSKVSVDRSLKRLGIDAERALNILKSYLKRVKKDKARMREKRLIASSWGV